MPPWLNTVIAIAGGLSAIATVFTLVKKAGPTVRTAIGVINDFAGEPARPGVDRKPGVIESIREIRDEQARQGAQLTELKTELGEQTKQVSAIQHELHPNSGLSLRDSVDRLENHLGIDPNAPKTPVKAPAKPRAPRKPRTPKTETPAAAE